MYTSDQIASFFDLSGISITREALDYIEKHSKGKNSSSFIEKIIEDCSFQNHIERSQLTLSNLLEVIESFTTETCTIGVLQMTASNVSSETFLSEKYKLILSRLKSCNVNISPINFLGILNKKPSDLSNSNSRALSPPTQLFGFLTIRNNTLLLQDSTGEINLDLSSLQECESAFFVPYTLVRIEGQVKPNSSSPKKGTLNTPYKSGNFAKSPEIVFQVSKIFELPPEKREHFEEPDSVVHSASDKNFGHSHNEDHSNKSLKIKKELSSQERYKTHKENFSNFHEAKKVELPETGVVLFNNENKMLSYSLSIEENEDVLKIPSKVCQKQVDDKTPKALQKYKSFLYKGRRVKSDILSPSKKKLAEERESEKEEVFLIFKIRSLKGKAVLAKIKEIIMVLTGTQENKDLIGRSVLENDSIKQVFIYLEEHSTAQAENFTELLELSFSFSIKVNIISLSPRSPIRFLIESKDQPNKDLVFSRANLFESIFRKNLLQPSIRMEEMRKQIIKYLLGQSTLKITNIGFFNEENIMGDEISNSLFPLPSLLVLPEEGLGTFVHSYGETQVCCTGSFSENREFLLYYHKTNIIEVSQL